MAIDLEAFEQALKVASGVASELRDGRSYDSAQIGAVLQWMLVQIDSLTKKVAELEKAAK